MNRILNKYQFCIKEQHFCDDNSLCLIIAQNLDTNEFLSIPIAQLIQDLELLAKFSPKDICKIAYLFAEDQMLKTQNWLQTQRNQKIS